MWNDDRSGQSEADTPQDSKPIASGEGDDADDGRRVGARRGRNDRAMFARRPMSPQQALLANGIDEERARQCGVPVFDLAALTGQWPKFKKPTATSGST